MPEETRIPPHAPSPGRIGPTDILLFVVCVVFLAGMLTLFRACAPHEDGSYMSCHWANRAVSGIAGALVVVSVLHFIAGPAQKQGMDLAVIPMAILAALLPGRLIALCMMETMRCHTRTAPGALVLGAVVALVALVDFIVQGIGKRK